MSNMEDELVHTAENDMSPAVRAFLAMRPCEDTPRHGDDCYSVFAAGTDFCLHAHIPYDQAYHSVFGRWPEEETFHE